MNQPGEGLAPGTTMALVAMGLGVLVIANDFTALNVALPAIEEDLDVDVGTAQWVINAYALTFGMVIVTGGRLADLFGRRRIFFIRAAIFAALSLGLLLLLLALDQSVDWGWGDWRVITMLALSAAMIIAFGSIEPRMGKAALIPTDVIANRRFASACATVLLMSAVFFTVVLYVPQLMEKVLNYTALEAGVAMLPMLATFAAVAFFAGRLYERIGGRPVITA